MSQAIDELERRGYKITTVELVTDRGSLELPYEKNKETLRKILDRAIDKELCFLTGFAVNLNPDTKTKLVSIYRLEWSIRKGHAVLQTVNNEDIIINLLKIYSPNDSPKETEEEKEEVWLG